MTKRILIVDDEPVNRDLLEAILAQEGFLTETAADGAAALAQATANPPDLILLDLLMPGMGGLEVCQRLKQTPATAAVPIIVVTAIGQFLTKEAALTSGADDFVTKPVQPDDLRTRVGAMLRVQRVEEELGRTLGYLQELEAARHAQRRATLAHVVVGEGVRAAEDTRPISVLLADDEALTREFFTELLTEHGFHVLTAASGIEALDLLPQHPVEVVLLDVVMPGMSGLEVLERLRAEDSDLPVIMLTGHPASLYSLAALKMGAFDFITKGLNLNLVVLGVHRAVRHRRETLKLKGELAQLRARVAELEDSDARQAPPNL